MPPLWSPLLFLVPVFLAPAALGSVVVTWTLSADNATLTLSVQGQGVGAGWVGLGIGATEAESADIVWARFASGVEVEDAFSANHTSVVRDTSQDISVHGVAFDGDSIGFEFTRPVQSPDALGDIDIDLNNPQLLFTFWSDSPATAFNLSDPSSNKDVRQVMWFRGDEEGQLTFASVSPSPTPSPPVEGVDISWLVAEDNSTITFTLRGQYILGWVGMAVSADEWMANSDIIWARSTGSGVEIEDAYAYYVGPPTRDSSQDVTLVSGGIVDSSIVVEFTRPIQSSDFADISIDLDHPQHLHTACGHDPSLSFRTAHNHYACEDSREVMWLDNGGQGSLSLVYPTPSPSPSDAPDEEGVTVEWELAEDNSTITFTVETDGVSGWVGICVSPTFLMDHCDVIWARSTGSGVEVEDAYALERARPVRDLSQDITVEYAEMQGSSIRFQVTRPVRGSDNTTDVEIDLEHPQYFQTAWSYVTATSFGTAQYHFTHHTTHQVMWVSDTRLPAPSPLVLPETTEGVTVTWEVADDNTTITFTVRAQGVTGWAGIGISHNRGMPNTDVIWARNTGGGVELEDAFSYGYFAPARDSSQDITVVSAELEGASMVFQFSRPVDSEDFADYAIDLDNPQFMFTAYSNTQGATFGSLANHGSNLRTYEVNWLAGTSTPQGKYRRSEWKVHGILMGISWGVLIPVGMLVPRFGKKHKQWFNAHRAIQTIALILAIAGFVVGVNMVKGKHLDHHQSHGLVGVVVMAIGVAQPLIAAVRPKDKTSVSRKRWYLVHAGLGVAGVVLGWLNCLSGMNIYDSPTSVRLALAAFAALVVGVVVLAELFKHARRTTAKKPDEPASPSPNASPDTNAKGQALWAV